MIMKLPFSETCKSLKMSTTFEIYCSLRRHYIIVGQRQLRPKQVNILLLVFYVTGSLPRKLNHATILICLYNLISSKIGGPPKIDNNQRNMFHLGSQGLGHCLSEMVEGG